MQPIGITLSLNGTDKVQKDLRAVRNDLGTLGPASQASARAASASLGSMNASAAQTAAALRMVPAQFTDIVVSLQSGQQPLTVLLQQGGQLKDMFGGILPAAKALGGYVLGLISPLTLLAGGVAALGVAYYQGSKEQDAFNQALIMTGNRVGTTTAALTQMAKVLNEKGYSQSGAADALAQLVQTGRVGEEQLERFAAVALDLEKRVGTPVQNTVKDLAELGKAPVEASIKLNEQYGYLTTATLAQIKALQDQGREEDAAAVAQGTYASAMSQRATEMQQHLGRIEKAWLAVKNAATGAWNAMVNAVDGRTDPRVKQLESLQAQLAARQAQAGVHGNDEHWQKGNEKLNAQIDALKQALNLEKQQAEQKAKNQAIQDAGIAAFERVAAANDKARTKQEQLNDALGAYRKDLDSLRAARALEKDPTKLAGLDAKLDPSQIAKAEAAIRKQFAEGSGGGGSLLAASRRADLADFQSTLRQEQALLQQRKQQLDIQYGAGLVTMEDYYSKQRAMIEESASLEESALQAQLSRLEQEKTKGVDALNVQRQIADVQSKLAVRRIQTQNEVAEADRKAAQAMQQHSAAMAQLNSNYTAYVGQLQSRADLRVASVGMGQERAAQAQGLLSIRENYSQQMRTLQDQRGTASNWTAENEAFYQERMRLLKQQQDDEVRIHEETYERIQLAQGDWSNGALRAMEDYLSSARNVAQQTQELFSSAFNGATDSLTSFVVTGDGKFKQLVNTIVTGLIRIQMQEMLTKSIGGSGGLLGSVVGAVAGLLGGVKSSNPGQYNLTTASNYSGGGMGLKVVPHAKGGVYESASLSMYRNQVLDKPTFFAFAKGGVPNANKGVMGEAGPEAIVPLATMPDGSLGVRTKGDVNGGAPHITYAPKIHVDARADAAQVYTLVRRAVREGQVELLQAQSRGYAV